MRQSNSVSPESFNTAFERLLPFEAYGPGVRRPPQLSAANLVRSMAFQALQGSGTLAESVKQTALLHHHSSLLGWCPFWCPLNPVCDHVPETDSVCSEQGSGFSSYHQTGNSCLRVESGVMVRM
jgi:hypothetical protein